MSGRITSLDLQKQEFRSRFRGYDPEEVRLFLRSVAEELERLNLDNAGLREELGRQREQLEELRGRERMLQNTLVTAQRMAEELKERSAKEAELLIKEARVKAERLLEQAQDQLERIDAEINRARLERDAFESRLRACIDEHVALLDLRKKERGQTENLHFLRRRSGSDTG